MPAQRVDHADEAVEIQLDEVLNGDPEVLLDGVDELIGALIEGSVDLVGTVGAGVGHEEVAGDGEDGERTVGRVEMQDHHDVAVHAVDALGAQSVSGVLHLEGAAVRRADHEDVLRARVLPLDRGRGEIFEVDAVDLVVEVPAVAGGRPGDQARAPAGRSRPPRPPCVCENASSGRRGPGPGVTHPSLQPRPCSAPACPARRARPPRSGARARAALSRRGCRRGPWATSARPPVQGPPLRSAGRAGADLCGRGRSRGWAGSWWRSDPIDVRPLVLVDARAPLTAPVWAAGTPGKPSQQHLRMAVSRARPRGIARCRRAATRPALGSCRSAESPMARPTAAPALVVPAGVVPVGHTPLASTSRRNV